MKRRKNYRKSIHQSDYFTVRALDHFLSAAIQEYVRPDLAVADIGCGEAPLRGAVEQHGGKYWGLDIEAHGSGSVCALASATALPLRPESIDIVLCTEVLEHVYDLPLALAEIARVLKQGGIAIVTAPFVYPLHEEPHDFGRPTQYALAEACRRAGLEVISLDALGDEMQVIGSLLDNTWTRMNARGPLQQLWRAERTVLRTLGNVFFGALSAGLRRSLPRKAYLGHALVARKETR